MEEEDILRLIADAARDGSPELHLSFRGIQTLPKEVGALERTHLLELSRNELRQLPKELFGLTQLKELHLNRNRLEKLPPQIGNLRDLEILDLRGNLLQSLPRELGRLKKLKRIFLDENHLHEVPPEISSRVEQPQVIINYLLQLQDSSERKPLNEAKLILVGQGGVGKTSLVRRLLHGDYDDREPKTEGINIDRWSVSREPHTLNLNMWDFGGQEIMHATHQFFLTKRSVYLLVLDARQGEHDSRLEYWLKLIHSFGGDSPVVVAINKSDQHRLDLNRTGLTEKYPFIRAFIDISCKTLLGLPELRSLLIETAGQLAHVNDLLPESWFDIKTTLSDIREDYISVDAYNTLCERHGVTDKLSQDTLIQLLHDLGIVLSFRDDPRLQDTNVLNPQWVTNGVYRLLNSYELFHSKGVLNVKQMETLLDPDRYPREKHLFLIQLMEKFELCFWFEGPPYERVLIPELLQREQPDLNWNHADSLAFQINYDILPSSVLSRFIVRMNASISQNTYWHSGVVLAFEDVKALVISDIEDRKISIWVQGPAPVRRGVLLTIRESIRAIEKTISKMVSTEKVPYKGILIDYEHLRRLEKMGEQTFVPQGLAERADVRVLLDGIDDAPERTPPTERPLQRKPTAPAKSQPRLEDRQEHRDLSKEYAGVWGAKVYWLAIFTLLPLFLRVKTHVLGLSLSPATIVYVLYHGLGIYLWMRFHHTSDPKAGFTFDERVAGLRHCTRLNRVHGPLGWIVIVLVVLTIVAKADVVYGEKHFRVQLPEAIYAFLGVPVLSVAS